MFTWLVTRRSRRKFRIDDDLHNGLRIVRERDGIPESEQIRRAVKAWLDRKGVKLKAGPRRAETRRRC